jgi:hypothetical protein
VQFRRVRAENSDVLTDVQVDGITSFGVSTMMSRARAQPLTRNDRQPLTTDN